jgi:hypothetical protein
VARVIAAVGIFDLDDRCAQIRQYLPRERCRDTVTDLDDCDPPQWR